ncbi:MULTISPECIES: MurR/RpiR family transcriptional regulator [unclassified Cellulomonas]|uniref:MurR/RpiR family transcriptional regulator n=1 Tax=unclassified Cellulomonas TaxID=2620175 RepID=UPI0019BBE3F9|nr:MurR/RpiR family transcriptional regulator [Cellulomonas sp. ES6]MBD3779303.1 MurR/RpiR family transcriptional regulator [Micrococcales bacterium]WHP17256.1 MurR/RpiR family transcriptional regulator [Cellulomonas sp. ES6]
MADGAVEVLDALRAALPRLGPAETRVAEVLLRDPEAGVAGTAATLGERAQVSRASVVRLAKTLGFSGLPALRVRLAQDLSRRAVELERSDIAEGTIVASDPLPELVAKVAFHEARTIEETARSLDLDALDRVAHAVAESHHVVVLGVGASGLAAADLAQKLQRIGLMCLSAADTHVQMTHAALADERTTAIAFSFSGGTVDVVRALEVAARAGARTVAITNDPRSPLAATAQEVLRTPAREATLRAAALASRMAQLAVVDFLFMRVGQLRFDDLGQALRATREAVDPQHLPPRA